MKNATARPVAPLPNAEKERAVPVSENDRNDIEQLYEAFRRGGKAKLISPNGESRLLPESLYLFLVELIGQLNEGKSVMIVQNQAKLTTMESANMLGVSRQFLVNLLEKGGIPYHMVGTHRRIYAQDLFQYKVARDVNRHKVLRDLSAAEAEDDLYDRIPPSIDAA
jgi:excisionase family DNA binding protein